MIVGLLTDEPVQPLPSLLGAKFDGYIQVPGGSYSKIATAAMSVRTVYNTY